MNTTGKIQGKGVVAIPAVVMRQAGLSKGDLVKFTFQRGKIVITPEDVTDRPAFPNADDEYTKGQRRVIDARLKKADADIKAGRMSKPFSEPAEFFAHLEKVAAKYGPRKSRRGGE